MKLACALAGVSLVLGMGTSARRLTLLVAPARPNTLQVAFDILARENAVLVSYQGDAATPDPRLHVWNGVEWLQISADEFATLSFLRTPPTQVVLVGDDALLPTVLLDAAMANTGARVMQIPAQDPATVVNSLGEILGFSRTDWGWFAGRYGLDLEDVNASIRDRSWYDQPNTLRGRTTSPWADPAAPGPAPAAMPAAAVRVEERPMSEPIQIPAGSYDYAPVMEPIPDAQAIPPAVEVNAPADEAPIK